MDHIVHGARHAQAARRRERFQAGRNIDPITEDVFVLQQDGTKMQANAEAKALFLLDVGVPHGDVDLRLDSTFDRIDDASEFR